MDLFIIRHGEPDLTGDLTDPPLTELGRRQADATAEFLREQHFDALYVSPQRRAQQTAEPLAAGRGLDPITDERIAEFDYELGSYVNPADFQKMTRDEAIALLDQYQGEAFRHRVLDAISHIIEHHSGQTVAVVCHGGVINAVVKDVLDSRHPLAPHHASLTRVAASRSGVRSLTTFNEHHWVPKS